jgi:hypothetical protein
MSRQNHNANYLYDTDGETVWEKLRVIRGFLEDRKIAYSLGMLAQEEQSKLDINSIDYRKWLINKPQHDKILQECLDEIKFLEEFESWLTQEAEKTRIVGKTDDEMYEINYFEELKIRLVKRAQAQFISTGRVEADTLQRIIKNKETLALAINSGILNNEVLPFIERIPNLEHRFNKLEYKETENE